MVTVIILTMLFGGGSVEIFSGAELRSVRSAIEEPERADAARQSMERVNEKLEALEKQRIVYFEMLSEINARVDAPADDYNAVIEQLWDARRDALDTYVDEVFVLRETITREEWDVAFNTR